MLLNEWTQKMVMAARKTGLEAATDLLLQNATECVYFSNATDRGIVRIGGSRTGGIPDLPKGTGWPKAKHGTEIYADFLVQVDLAELPAFQELPLPPVGHLWFFLTSLEGDGEVAVLYDPRADAVLEPCPRPGGSFLYGQIFDSRPLALTRGVSLKCSTAFCDELFALARHGSLEDLMQYLNPYESVGQIGGFCHSNEGADLAQAVAMIRMGKRDLISRYSFDNLQSLVLSETRTPGYLSASEQAKVRNQIVWVEENFDEVTEWRLFARFGTNGEIGLSIGDSYGLGLFTRLSDLRAGIFANAVTMFVV